MPQTKPTSEQVTFLQAGTGATQRTALAKLRDTVSVKDFGAVGDGTTDDTAAIQAALNASSSSVYVPVGSYKLTSKISIPTNSRLYGDGNSSEFFMASQLDIMVEIVGDNVNIGDMSFRGTNTSIPAAGVNERTVVATNRANIVVSNCRFWQTVIGLQFATCSNIKVCQSYFSTIKTRDDGTQGYGILCNSDTAYGIIANNSFSDMGRHAVYISSGSSKISVSNNVIENCDSVGINLGAFTGQNQVQDIVIIGNIIRSIAGSISPHGISISQKCGYVDITGNLMRTIGSYGIFVNGSNSNSPSDNPISINIRNNTCIGCDRGISIVNAQDILCDGNVVASSTGIGIEAATDGAGIGSVGTRFRITNNSVNASGTYGLLLSGTASSTDYFVEGNYITNSTTADYWTPTLNGSALPATQIVYGDPRMQFTFTATAITASQTDVAMVGAAAGFTEYVIPSSMYALVNVARHASAITAGTITVILTKNGTNQTVYNVVLNNANQATTNNQGLYLKFAAGDRIGMRYSTNAAYVASGTAAVQSQIELVKAST